MKIAVIGAGGFAREVVWLINDIRRERASLENVDSPEFAGFVVTDQSRAGQAVNYDLDWLRANPVDALALGIGNPEVRLRLAHELKRDFPEVKFPALIHPSVQYDFDSCEFGRGAIVCAGTILTVNVRVEPFAMINLSCTVGHEAIIGEGTVINPLCAISGGVKIGKGCLIGTHAAILQDLTVGEGAIIGSGAMVHRNVPAGTTVMGVPAKAKQQELVTH